MLPESFHCAKIPKSGDFSRVYKRLHALGQEYFLCCVMQVLGRDGVHPLEYLLQCAGGAIVQEALGHAYGSILEAVSGEAVPCSPA